MKLLVISDIHTEFGHSESDVFMDGMTAAGDKVDVVIAAGDIGIGLEGLHWLQKVFPKKPVIYVPGNHEYYRQDYDLLQDQFRQFKSDNIHVLNPGIVEIDGYSFVGATGWTTFTLNEYPKFDRDLFDRSISDFRLISRQAKLGHRFDTADCANISRAEIDYIEQQLEYSIKDNSKTVVITHFVPSQQCIDPKYLAPQFLRMNAYFTNDWDWLWEKYNYPLHVFGHTHSRYNGVASNGTTQLVCNPLGYPNENPGNYWPLFVEI